MRLAGRTTARRRRGAAFVDNRAALETFELNTDTTGDNPFDGLAGQRIGCQRLVCHSLSYLKATWFAPSTKRNSFINVGWHSVLRFQLVAVL